MQPKDFNWPSIQTVRHVKGSATSGRQVFQVRDGERLYAMKTHRHRSPRKMWRARAQSPLRNELAMLKRAREAGLPVPEPITHGARRIMGLVTQDALLVEWIDDKRLLRDKVDRDAIDVLAAMLGRIRRAGFADRDFTFSQILVNDAMDPTWFDLEAAYPSAPDDPEGTADIVGMALANVWNVTNGDRAMLQYAWDRIRDEAPKPKRGWEDAWGAIHQAMIHGVKKAMRRGRVDKLPPGMIYNHDLI